MNALFSVFAGLWLGFMSLFGAGHAQQPSTQPEVDSSTSMQQTVAAQPVGQPDSSAQQAPDTSPSSANASASVSAQATASLPAGSAYRDTLPLGDGKYTTSGAKKGYVYVCHVASGGGGAQGSATWIHGSSWSVSEKVAVQGSVSWPQAKYSMSVSGSTRYITGNGLPTDHTTGVFPISLSDPAHQFDGNPNSISAQSDSFSFPAYPTMRSTPACIYGQVGIMTDGVALFDGFDAEYRDAVAHETQDSHEGHPEKTGEYHYHGFEDGPLNQSVSTVVGFAFDGYPITGGKLPSGTYLTSTDLDECHGITSAVTLDGKTVTTYHYVLTQDFPYSVSCFRGTSYEPKPGGGQQGGGQTGAQGSVSGSMQAGGSAPTPPQAALDACVGKSSGASCQVAGRPTGTCKTPPGQSALACVPQ